MKKMWVLKRVEDNSDVVYNSNYFTFCGKVRKFLAQEDTQAIQELKKELGDTYYCPEVKSQFKACHDSVFAKFKVIQGTVPDENKSNDITGFTDGNENPAVYKYLWQTKPVGNKK